MVTNAWWLLLIVVFILGNLSQSNLVLWASIEISNLFICMSQHIQPFGSTYKPLHRVENQFIVLEFIMQITASPKF